MGTSDVMDIQVAGMMDTKKIEKSCGRHHARHHLRSASFSQEFIEGLYFNESLTNPSTRSVPGKYTLPVFS
jgi:hypothetical protein